MQILVFDLLNSALMVLNQINWEYKYVYIPPGSIETQWRLSQIYLYTSVLCPLSFDEKNVLIR